MNSLQHIATILCVLAATLAHAGESVGAAMKVSGRFATGYSWQLAIAGNGAAKLAVEKPDGPSHKSLEIPPAKLDELRELLLRERFFDLDASYGDSVPDGSTTTISAQMGARTKTVELHFLRHEDPRLDEIRRAVRVSLFLRDLFEHPDAVDLRRYDKLMLKDSSK